MSAEPPVISVIIHFLNAARYLPDAVGSVLRQTFAGWELILVDGGSTDESSTIAREYSVRAPDRVRALRYAGPGRLGIFSSRIWGAREARASVLAHLDSDDEWDPRFLEQQAALHRQHFTLRPGLVYCPMVYWSGDGGEPFQPYVQPVPPPGVYEPPDLLPHFLDEAYARTPGNSAVIVNREIILAASELVGTADEGMVEDQFLWSFIGLRYPIAVSSAPLTRYRQWPGSTCAVTVRSGAHHQLRESHLRWLEQYLLREYSGSKRDMLLGACRVAAGKAPMPPSKGE